LHDSATNISAAAMAKDKKAERLAAALRENLKRRKAQQCDIPPPETQKNEPSQPASE
jgi:hypothetical protein